MIAPDPSHCLMFTLYFPLLAMNRLAKPKLLFLNSGWLIASKGTYLQKLLLFLVQPPRSFKKQLNNFSSSK